MLFLISSNKSLALQAGSDLQSNQLLTFIVFTYSWSACVTNLWMIREDWLTTILFFTIVTVSHSPVVISCKNVTDKNPVNSDKHCNTFILGGGRCFIYHEGCIEPFLWLLLTDHKLQENWSPQRVPELLQSRPQMSREGRPPPPWASWRCCWPT